jgi:heterotetrameric sarcosine oxidase gamma subunit
LRGHPTQPEFLAHVEAVSGVPLPTRRGETATGHGNIALSLAADEWLLVTPAPLAASLTHALRERLRPFHASVIDVSCGSIAMQLSGEGACDILARSCSLDLRPERFAVGHCARTRIARFAVLVHCIDAAPAYDLYVARSYARSFWEWLVDGLEEFR